MIERKKILLPTEDIITRGSEDLFINFNLDRSFKEIKPIVYQNNFDLTKMFDDERNSSRNFCIYGTVESVDIDCDEVELDVYLPANNIGKQSQNAGVSFIRDREIIELTDGTILNYFDTIVTNGVAYGKGNVFGKKRGVYKLDLNNFQKDTAYLTFTKAKRSILNANSEFSNGLKGWGTVGSGVNTPGWIADQNKRRIYVTSNGISYISNGVFSEGINFTDDFDKYRFSVRVNTATQYPITLLFNPIDNGGSLLLGQNFTITIPPGGDKEAYVDRDYLASLNNSSSVALFVLYDSQEPSGSKVEIDYFRVSPTPTQVGDIVDIIDNGNFTDGLSNWSQSAGAINWEHNIPGSSVQLINTNLLPQSITSSLLSQPYNFLPNTEYFVSFEYESNVETDFKIYAKSGSNPKSFEIGTINAKTDTGGSTDVIKFTLDGNDYTDLVLEAIFPEPQPNVKQFFQLKKIALYPKIENVGTLDAVVEEVQLFRNQVVFYDDDNNLVKYGSDTLEISSDGNIEVVQNDFPFFYNIHWIKSNIEIKRVVTRFVTFDPESSFITEGESTNINISLDKPSALGIEKATILITSDTATEGEDYEIAPKTLQWNKGETTKIVTLTSLVKEGADPVKVLNLTLDNLQKLELNPESSSAEIQIQDSTINRYTKVTIPAIFSNLKSFGKRVTTLNDAQVLDEVARSANFRNGALFNETPEEFYPADTFTLKITNKGEAVTLDPIPGLTTDPTDLGFGESLSAEVQPIFLGDALPHQYSIVINKPSGAVNAAIDINGHIYLNISNITDLIAAVQSDNTSKSFTLTTTGNNSATIESANSGIPVVINIFDPSTIITLTEIEPYTYLDQVPFSLNLKGNRSKQQYIDYNIELSKPGFQTISIDTGQLETKESNFDDYKLGSSFSTIVNYLDGQTCISVGGVGLVGDIVFNGALFISNNTSSNDGTSLNLTGLGSLIDGESLKFSTSDIVPAICTEETVNFNGLKPYNSEFV